MQRRTSLFWHKIDCPSKLFMFSLKDKVRAWLHSLPPRLITSWDELTKSILAKFFALSKTASLRDQITKFGHKEHEFLYEARKHFKDLLQLCLHRGLLKSMMVQTSYNGVTQLVQSIIDATVRGILMTTAQLRWGHPEQHPQWGDFLHWPPWQSPSP